eukprot:4211384-Prymnesium_polylepis.1
MSSSRHTPSVYTQQSHTQVTTSRHGTVLGSRYRIRTAVTNCTRCRDALLPATTTGSQGAARRAAFLSAR